MSIRKHLNKIIKYTTFKTFDGRFTQLNNICIEIDYFLEIYIVSLDSLKRVSIQNHSACYPQLNMKKVSEDFNFSKF